MATSRVLASSRAAGFGLALSVVAACGGTAESAGGAGLAASFAVAGSVAATLALLHGLLFAFEPRDRRNLYLTLLAAAFAVVVFLDYRDRVGDAVVLLVGDLQRWAVSAVIIAAARFVFALVSDHLPLRFWLYSGAIFGLLVAAIPYPGVFPVPAGLLGLAITVDILVTLVRGWRRLERGGWIVGVGTGLFALAGFTQLGLDLLGAEDVANSANPYLWGGLALLLASSLYLAWTFTLIRRELEHRLVEVEELSAQALAHEQAAREEEVRRRLLEAEDRRKGRELEDARSLQLAMLPEELPEVPGYELAATMLTATEVGGDYYDAALSGHGATWLAVGDAVGHGARAGTLVAVAKSLFTTVTTEASPAAALTRFDAALRGMGLRRANLALLVARLAPGRVEIAAAGMPPALVRRKDGAVEEVAFATLPLGAPLAKSYENRTVALTPGDLLLFLTDGLVELPGDDGAPRGYEALGQALARSDPGEDEPLSIWIDRFVAGLVSTPPPPDDVTVLVIRRAPRDGS